MPDELPDLPFSLATIADRLRSQPPANYREARTRLGRQPVMYAQDAGQYSAVDSPANWGGTFQPTLEQKIKLRMNPAAGPLADPLRALLGQGQPVSVIAPEQASKTGLAGDTSGTPAGVTLHEATHQFVGSNKLPLDILKSKIDPQLMARMRQALEKQNYTGDNFGDEIPARLASGQFDSLGLSPKEGQQLWDTYLTEYSKVAPRRANRLRMYTSGRSMQPWEPPTEQNP
jgi:hypothetical protein